VSRIIEIIPITVNFYYTLHIAAATYTIITRLAYKFKHRPLMLLSEKANLTIWLQKSRDKFTAYHKI